MRTDDRLPPDARPPRVPRRTSWRRLAYVRAYTLKHGMRAAKLTAVMDCIKALKAEHLRLP